MAAIDRFIEVGMRHGADRIVLAAGEQVLLVCGNETRTLTTQPLVAVQVEDLLYEILPPDIARAAAADGYHDFVHPSPHGAIEVRLHRAKETLRVMLQPQRTTAATAAPRRTVGTVSAAPILREAAPESAEGVDANSTAAPPVRESFFDATQFVQQNQAPAHATAPRLHTLLEAMVEHRCSDLHLSSGSPPLYRKDGEITSLGDKVPLTSDDIRTLLLDVTPVRNQEEFEARRDTDFAYEMSEEARFRANLFMDRRGMGAVFRFIPGKIPSVRELGLSKAILDLCDLSKGLILVTGPTGSGKSTTLAAMIDYINARRSGHIITIEDPIEFVHTNRKCLVNQREVGMHTQDFKSALRAALREDPDILLVGEMRDLETMEIAIETAETGHLVFGTLHTNTATSAVDRIIEQFPSDRQSQIRIMLADSLKGVIAQTLLKRRGGGLVAAMEFLGVNGAVSNLIREAKAFQVQSIMQTSKNAGMMTLNDALIDLVKAGLVDVEHAIAKSVNRVEFKGMLERGGVRIPAPREPVTAML
jgi:twitching motility protein PilT